MKKPRKGQLPAIDDKREASDSHNRRSNYSLIKKEDPFSLPKARDIILD